ncbi:uncharacterized protein LOC135486923 [Lineus longissimus]|uniref:uncharacterized protein LOC135486923 n=1 Tax=Lineus longissimus TaxID=88925 RepID=UPI00315D5A7F
MILQKCDTCIAMCVDKKGPNVARGKPASQSTTYDKGEASKAVDGNPNPSRYQDYSCTHTRRNYPPPWWFVDLKARHSVNSVTIINRSDGYGNRLKDFDVIISEVAPPSGFSSGEVCYSHQGNSANGQIYNLPCQGKVGRFVGVRLRDAGTLSLCEVEVYGNSWSYMYYAITASEELKLVATNSLISLSECSYWCLKCLDCYEFSFTNEVCRMYGKDVIAGTPSPCPVPNQLVRSTNCHRKLLPWKSTVTGVDGRERGSCRLPNLGIANVMIPYRCV